MTPAIAICAGVATVALAAAAAAAVEGRACFEDIEQHYEWDDGGLQWKLKPDRCPGSPQPASPLERKWGGSLQVRVSGSDAIVIEEDYAWVPKRFGDGTECPRFFKAINRKTRVAKNGVLYETTETADMPTRHSQRVLQPNQIIYIPSISTVPKLDDPYLQRLGTDTIAGQPCERVAQKAALPGAASSNACVFVAPLNCPAARYLQPLESTVTGPDGQVTMHGRTTLLRVGGRGTVVAPDSIRAP